MEEKCKQIFQPWTDEMKDMEIQWRTQAVLPRPERIRITQRSVTKPTQTQ